jgi:hypothetical protein
VIQQIVVLDDYWASKVAVISGSDGEVPMSLRLGGVLII